MSMRNLLKKSRKIDKFIDTWGLFVENIVAPGIQKILCKRFGIKTTGIAFESRAYRRGETMGVDILVIGKGKKDEDIVIIASVKDRLQKSDVIDFINDLKKFHIFFPEYRNYKLQGLVCGIKIDKGVDKYAENIGLYVLGSSGETVKLLNKPGFKPKIW